MSDQTLAPSQPPPLPPSDHLQPFPIIPILTTGSNNNSSTSTSDNTSSGSTSDNTSSGSTSDNTSPSVLPNPHDSIMSRAFYWLRSFYIPTSPSQLQLTQKKMFEKFVRQPVEHKLFMLKSGDYLNYIDMKGSSSTIPAAARNHPGSIVDTSENKKKKPTLILMHGYGSGLGMFFANYDKFSSQFDRIVAIDWLGMGGSSRCRTLPQAPLLWGSFQQSQAVDYFIDSLEEARQGLGIESDFVLAGHSLGGFLSARYAMKYRDSGMKGLVLFSPAGLEPLSDHEIVPQKEISNWKLLWAERLWRYNFTPQGVVRLLGPWGTGAVRNLVNMRFGADKWPQDEAGLISDYLFHLCALPHASENALSVIFEPRMVKETRPGVLGAQRPRVFTKEPISPEDLGPALGGDKKKGQSGIPLLLMYGDHDWMGFPTANTFVSSLQKEHNVNTTFAVVPSAGHHLYLDNTEEFHRIVDSWLDKSVNKVS